jgi:hypothetical protein
MQDTSSCGKNYVISMYSVTGQVQYILICGSSVDADLRRANRSTFCRPCDGRTTPRHGKPRKDPRIRRRRTAKVAIKEVSGRIRRCRVGPSFGPGPGFRTGTAPPIHVPDAPETRWWRLSSGLVRIRPRLRGRRMRGRMGKKMGKMGKIGKGGGKSILEILEGLSPVCDSQSSHLLTVFGQRFGAGCVRLHGGASPSTYKEDHLSA